RTEDRGRRTEVKKMTKHPAFAEASAWQANDEERRNDRVKLRHAATKARMERSCSCSLNLRRRRHIIVSPGACAFGTDTTDVRTEDRGRRTEVKKMTKHPAFAEASAWQANDEERRNDRVKLRHAATKARMERSCSCSLNLRRRRHIIVSPGACAFGTDTTDV